MKKKFNLKKVNLFVVTTCMVLLLITVGIGNCVAIYWGGALEVYLGSVGESGVKGFESTYTDDELMAEEINTAKQVIEEACVLLKNDKEALPLEKGTKISLFGYASVDWVSGASTGSDAFAQSDYTLKQALEQAGFSVNETLWNYYVEQTTGRVLTDYAIPEIEWSKVQEVTGDSYSDYNDVALVVLSRSGGEGTDLPLDMEEQDGGDEGKHYLELSNTELDLLRGVRSAGFSKIVLVLNSAFAMQMDFLQDDTLQIDACITCPATGNAGILGIGTILNGEVSPSGHLIDTLVYDNYSAPAMQNIGNNIYTQDGKELTYTFLGYAEGIYVGYKYYETRYEDVVMGTENVGVYDYTSTVAFPFGFGLSYTEFTWSNFRQNVEDEEIIISVDITNTGKYAGKEVVEVYFQSPYTQYDIEKGVEKASVSLAGFAKTDILEPQETETVKISFNAQDIMKSYSIEAGSYIMDEGNYLITVAEDAHAAINNILAHKQYSTDDGMTEAGNVDLVGVYQVPEFLTIQNDLKTGTAVTNQFEFAEADVTYLTRSNWLMMDDDGLRYATGVAADGISGTREIMADTLANIRAKGWRASGRPESADNNEEAIFGADNGLRFVDMNGASYDDERWKLLIDETSVGEIHSLFNRAGYMNSAIESIQKPLATDLDGPSGLRNHVTSWTSFHWPSGTAMAATWNIELAEKMGELVGEDSLRTGVAGWYAPAMNIHRMPFCGRNAEYYSEDSLLSGMIGAYEVKGAQSKGVYCYIKHFAMNNQEVNRRGANTWANEQTIREIYLKPFEISVKIGNAHGVMASMNRIGYRYTQACYPLLTTVLRNEWGFEGAVITDYTSAGGEVIEQSLAAGCDLILSTAALKLPDTKSNHIRNALKEAAFHTCYMLSTSNLMNSLDGSVEYNPGVPVYKILLVVLDVITVLVSFFAILLAIRGYRKSCKNLETDVNNELNEKGFNIFNVFSLVSYLLSGVGLVLIACHVLIPGIVIATLSVVISSVGYALKYKKKMNIALSYWAFVISIIVLILCIIGFCAYTIWDMFSAANVG